MTQTEKLCALAKNSAIELSVLSGSQKNEMLSVTARSLIDNSEKILKANAIDIQTANDNNMPAHFIDRLTLTFDRIKSVADGILEVMKLNDPIGEVLESYTAKSGVKITKKRVPIGVIGVIYEARPNVTCDVAALCLKSGNCVVLRGSSDTINTNKVIVKCIKENLLKSGYNPNFIQLIEDTTREGVLELMKLNQYIDLLIPRGGAKLIQSVVQNSTVPVIETGAGNCHIYVESSADFKMANDIIINAKCQRPSVCNAAESLLVDEKIAKQFLPDVLKQLSDKNVEIRACEKTAEIYKGAKLATDDDFYTEYNDYIISVKVVSDIDEAINHINKYGTKHSEAIITGDNLKAEKFFAKVDSAALYHNASTRFTDGFEFGLGAEIGISTQKIHARGPMGLKELTSYKYIIEGNGNIRK